MFKRINKAELQQERAGLRESAEKRINAAIASRKDLQGADLEAYQTEVARIKEIDADLERYAANSGRMATPEQLAAMGLPNIGGNNGRPAVASAPSGLKSHLREIYSRANAEQREQIDGIAAYLTGRGIMAAANLVPSSDGGVIIPSFVVSALERDYAAFAPVVSVSRIWGTDTGADTVFPVLSDSESAEQVAAAAATGADGTVSGDTPPTALTGPTLKAWKVSSKPVFVPRETFTDSPVDIISEIIGALLARIIRFENLKYTAGVGVTVAEGFLKNATKLVTGAVALDLDICLDLAYNVPALYRSGGVYQMSDTTAKYLRKLKTGITNDKQMLWADADATKGQPATLHGYPVVINNDMDSVAADGTFAGTAYL
jgi:HK97 family phage major capsid protein